MTVQRERRNLVSIMLVLESMRESITYVTERLAARLVLANVWAFACVSSVVNCQSRSLNKLFAAAGPFAVVRTFAGVDASMARKVGSAREGLAAIIPGAFERFVIFNRRSIADGRDGGSSRRSQEHLLIVSIK